MNKAERLFQLVLEFSGQFTYFERRPNGRFLFE